MIAEIEIEKGQLVGFRQGHKRNRLDSALVNTTAEKICEDSNHSYCLYWRLSHSYLLISTHVVSSTNCSNDSLSSGYPTSLVKVKLEASRQ